jgi:hypothetical protein
LQFIFLIPKSVQTLRQSLSPQPQPESCLTSLLHYFTQCSLDVTTWLGLFFLSLFSDHCAGDLKGWIQFIVREWWEALDLSLSLLEFPKSRNSIVSTLCYPHSSSLMI